MELRINEYQLPAAISFNFDEIKNEVADKVELYKNMVYSDDQIKMAKADKATLNKFRTALEDERKRIKKECLAPYEEFEAQIKEIVAIIDEPIKLIGEQVGKFDEQQKKEKKLQIMQLWAIYDKPQWLSLDAIWDEKWLNKTMSMSKIGDAILTKLESINTDMTTIEKMEFKFEAMEMYKKTLSLSDAISKGQELLDIQLRKEEEEKRRAAAEEVARQKALQEDKTEPQNEDEPLDGQITTDELLEAEPVDNPPFEQEKKQWLGFRACMTVSQAKKLAEFCKAEGIKLEPFGGK